MSKQVNVDFVTRQIEVDTDGKEHFISAAMAAKDAEASMLNAHILATKAENAALVNTRWPYTDERSRKVGKYNYKLENGDLVLTVPSIVKLNVEE